MNELPGCPCTLEESNFVILNFTVLHSVVYRNLIDELNNTVDTTKILVFFNVATCFDILMSSSG